MSSDFWTREVVLEQSVRCTQRILAGALTFAKANLDTIASHGTEGPPLRTFLFPRQSDVRSAVMQQYAEVVSQRAFRSLLDSFSGLSWDNRLMIICPTDEFCQGLKAAQLESQLQQVRMTTKKCSRVATY